MARVNQPTYRIILRAQPQTVEPGARLQRLLKVALRSFGFRCKRVEEITPTVTKGNTPANLLTMASIGSNGDTGSQKRSRKRKSPRNVVQKPD